MFSLVNLSTYKKKGNNRKKISRAAVGCSEE